MKAKLIYGDGKILTQQAKTHEGLRCLILTEHPYCMPINSTPAQWKPVLDESEFDVLIGFKSLAAARVLQDELNALVSQWSKEEAQIVAVPGASIKSGGAKP